MIFFEENNVNKLKPYKIFICLIAAIAIYWGLFVNNKSMAKTETQPDIKKCLMNLEAVESHIEKQKPNFSPKLAIGLSGWLSMLHGGLKENDLSLIHI